MKKIQLIPFVLLGFAGCTGCEDGPSRIDNEIIADQVDDVVENTVVEDIPQTEEEKKVVEGVKKEAAKILEEQLAESPTGSMVAVDKKAFTLAMISRYEKEKSKVLCDSILNLLRQTDIITLRDEDEAFATEIRNRFGKLKKQMGH